MNRYTPLYVIPARGGSKGIPRKNVKPLCGRPLIHYSIDVARQLSDDSHVILSTDDDGIAECARMAGLPVAYRRPAQFATDSAGSREVILDAMDWADRNGLHYDCVVLLQPTSPFRTADDVVNALSLYSPDIDMVVSVTESAANPYYDCFETDAATGYLHVSKGSGTFTRRQDAPKAWQYNGAVYVINPESIRREPLGRFRRRVPVEMPPERSVDLDTPLDWIVAEILMDRLQNQQLPQGVKQSKL